MDQLFVTTITTRKVGTLDVISFFKYSTLETLLHSKHKPEGHRVYKALLNMIMKPFIEAFTENDHRDVYIVGIDEYVKNGYAHVELLTRSMKTQTSIPQYSVLMSQNRVNYSGKSLQFRLENSREFIYKGKQNVDVILVHDIINTVITLQEAKRYFYPME